LKVVPAGGRQLSLQLPICDRDRKAGAFAIDHPHGTSGRVMDAASFRIPILWVFWSLFQFFNWVGTPRQARGDQFLVVRGVCPEFLDALDEMEDREDLRGEDEAEGDDAPRRARRKSEGPGALPWILAGVGTVVVVFACCGGLVIVGAVTQSLRKQQGMAANPPPIQVQVPQVPPAVPQDGGGLPQPPPPPLRPPFQPAPAEAPKAAPGEILPAFEGHNGNIIALAFAPKGGALLAGCEDGSVCWWREGGQGGPPQPKVVKAVNTKPYGLALAPDGRTAAVTAWEGTVQLVDGNGAGVLDTLQPRTGFVSLGLAFSTDSQTLLTGHFGGDIKVWDVRGAKLRQTLKGGNDWTMAVAFSPDGKLFATTGGGDYSITLWDAATLQQVGALKGHDAHGAGSVRYLAFSPDSKTLASGCDDGTARLWDVAGRRERAALTHPEKQVEGVAFTPDGALVITGCKDGQVRLWDAATGRRRAAVDVNSMPFGPGVTAVAVSPDGKTFVAGSGPNVRRWDRAKVLAAQPGG
jgi:DNA-binding beta-propeller fold protein YncE